MLNTITLTMTVHGDPESKTYGDKVITKVRAFASQGKDKEGEYKPSMWISVQAWSSRFVQKDIAALRDKSRFSVTGALRLDEWTDNDGNKRQSYYIDADRIEAPKRENSAGYRGGSATKHHEQNSRGGGYKQPEQPYDADGEPGVPF